MPQTGYLINNRLLFLSVLESGKSKIKAPEDSASGESLLSGSLPAVFSLCPYRVEGVKELFGASFVRASIWELHSHDLTPLKGTPSKQHYNGD